jgi:hypothetical protein
MPKPTRKVSGKHFHCEDCGPIESAVVNGYAVGDTLLEQVYFTCTIGPNGKISVVVTPECANYFQTLNQKKWLKEVRDFVNRPGCDSFECPTCKHEGLGFVSVVET